MILPYLAITLLILATLYSVVASFIESGNATSGTWLFPSRTKPSARKAIGLFALAIALGLAIWLSLDARKSIRHSSRFLIPEGYVGWVRVDFQVDGAAPVPVEKGEDIFKFPASGVLKTSSPEEYGWANDHYFYYSDKGERVLPVTGFDGHGLIWGKMNGEASAQQGSRKYEEFFVGTREQFAEQTSQPQKCSK